MTGCEKAKADARALRREVAALRALLAEARSYCSFHKMRERIDAALKRNGGTK